VHILLFSDRILAKRLFKPELRWLSTLLILNKNGMIDPSGKGHGSSFIWHAQLLCLVSKLACKTALDNQIVF
jgi:hypothetical protein